LLFGRLGVGRHREVNKLRRGLRVSKTRHRTKLSRGLVFLALAMHHRSVPWPSDDTLYNAYHRAAVLASISC
jgi:hypothetical protein